jgi:hypothetical protein
VTIFDPFTVSDELRDAYLRYLSEAHPIHPNEPLLRRKFQEAIAETDRFVREPLVSAIPSYAHSKTPEQLLASSSPPHLDPHLRKLNAFEFDLQRPLYQHQVKAIDAIQRGNNVVVATGTGSGKTECFLLPILDAAARAKEPGIVAIIVYPMNALAEDQLRRLRSLLRGTKITFGRYTGQTRAKREDVPDDEWREAAHPNELVTREQIRENPPHILLTNFAMLEYLLLRPQDQVIFRHPTVQYLVLDEAHTYSGAQGIDVSLLMRRVQLRYERKLQFILTSATMGGSAPKIASFASGLTGSDFKPDGVIFGDVAEPFDDVAATSVTPDTVIKLAQHANPTLLADALASDKGIHRWLEACGIRAADGKTPPGTLYESIRRLEPIRKLYDALRERPCSISELSDIALPDSIASVIRNTAVRTLCSAASLAKPDYPHASPLMSVRVHHFFRGLSGASVALGAGANATAIVKDVVLEDRQQDDAGVRLLSIRTCVHCGMPVAVIRMQDGDHWERPVGKSNQPIRLLTWFALEGEDADADGDEDQDAQTSTSFATVQLCLDCGRFSGDAATPPCTCVNVLKLRLLTKGDAEGNLPNCPCCGGDKGQYDSVLRDFMTGEDAPTALLAEEIIRRLPELQSDRPAAGRRLLAFSDSRQRAAYFMPYLTRTAAEPSYIQPILTAARFFEAEEKRPGTAPEILESAQQHVLGHDWIVFRRTDQADLFDRYQVKKSGQLSPDERRALRHELALSLYQSITASSRQRTKIIGLKLAAPAIELTDDEYAKAQQRCPDLFRKPSVGRDSIQRLLMALVRRGVVRFEPISVTYRHLVAGASPLVTVHLDPAGRVTGRRRVRWNPFLVASNRRRQAVTVSRILPIIREAVGNDDEALLARTLDQAWEWMVRDSEILRPTNEPGEYQLPAGRILLVTSPARWFACQRCGAPSIHPMTGVCEIHDCGGKLLPVEPASLSSEHAASHRVGRFLREPLPLVVREHTAQLEPEQGRRYQDEFNKSFVNVLSCSTTFEMGVDVGTLEAVLLRNVPPTPANYIQRAGRAGRRKQGVAHAVTYARTMPHDQYHYFRPHEIVNGVVPVPVIYPGNVRLTQRHVNSFLLGRFLADRRSAFASDNATVEEFFPTPPAPSPDQQSGGGALHPIVPSGDNSPASQFGGWIDAHRKELLAEAGRIIPNSCPLQVSDALNEAAGCLFSSDPALKHTVYYRGVVSPLQSYDREAQQLQDEILKAINERQNRRVSGLAHAKDRVDRLKDQLQEQRLIDFLSGLNWLPGYAFPQNNVRLLVRQQTDRDIMRLERDRELAISEYSPGSQIIADGKLFESVGINLEWREPELKYYRFSQATRRIFIGNTLQDVVDASPNVAMRPIQFLEPLGFTTMWDAPVEEPNLFRLRPPSNTEVFLVDGAESFQEHADLPGVHTGIRSDAALFRGNMGKTGRGFRLCLRCGAEQESARSRGAGAHESPWGTECRGRFEPAALAHIFRTDVLQIRLPQCPVIGNASFWLTLSTALTNAACEALSIDPKDLDSTYRSQSADTELGEIVIFDRVPGGAGHVEQIRQQLRMVFAATIERLEHCRNPDCSIDGSCYACLRSHRNQFSWSSLKRSEPLPYIKRFARSAGEERVR